MAYLDSLKEAVCAAFDPLLKLFTTMSSHDKPTVNVLFRTERSGSTYKDQESKGSAKQFNGHTSESSLTPRE